MQINACTNGVVVLLNKIGTLLLALMTKSQQKLDTILSDFLLSFP